MAQVSGIICDAPTFGCPGITLLDRDKIDQLAAAQGIADQMTPRPHGDMRLGWVIKAVGDQRPPRHLSRKLRGIIPVQRRAGFGMNAAGVNDHFGTAAGLLEHL